MSFGSKEFTGTSLLPESNEMPLDQPIETSVRRIHEMDRNGCIHELMSFRAIPLDFSREYLDGMSDERLRHVLLAAVLTVHTRRRSA